MGALGVFTGRLPKLEKTSGRFAAEGAEPFVAMIDKLFEGFY
jgi:hypothetical protein